MLGKALWLLAALGLIMAWVASTRPDGTYCLKAREANGSCASGIPVAHFFLDSLALSVLSLGLGGCKMSSCGKSDCEGGSCDEAAS